jgi:acyl carrier protein
MNPQCLSCPADSPVGTLGLESVGMIELVEDLEGTFSIALADEDMVPANFSTIRSLTALVAAKQG